MHDRRVALVTGANQGVGLQVATELVAGGLTVLVGPDGPTGTFTRWENVTIPW
jgi:NAD(P)-dependent dehydrogenase (short-subunit alcohol dehydrogenase family)